MSSVSIEAFFSLSIMITKSLFRLFTSKRVLVAIANGSEEIETMAPIDILRRAGAHVTIASIGPGLQVTMSRGVQAIADKPLSEVKDQVFDAIIIPGGQPGANNMRDCAILIDMLKRQKREERWTAAICASPVVVLQTHGLLNGPATCHPSVGSDLQNKIHLNERVVVSGKCVTSRAPGTAIEFSLKLVEVMYGLPHAQAISQQILS